MVGTPRNRLAEYFFIERDTYDRYQFACVIGGDSCEEIFKRAILRLGVQNVHVHNHEELGDLSITPSTSILDDLINQEVSFFQNNIGMSFDAYLQLGSLFFNREELPFVSAFGDALSTARAEAAALVEYHRRRHSSNTQDIELWAELKTVEDERMQLDHIHL